MTDNSEQSQSPFPSNERCPHGISLTANPPCHFCEHAREVERLTRERQANANEIQRLYGLVNHWYGETGRLRTALERCRLTSGLAKAEIIDAALSGEPDSAPETNGNVEAELDEDRRIFGMAYWLETAAGKVRLNPEELRMRMSDGGYRVVADMDTVAQQQAVFDFVVSLRRDAYNAQKREPFIPIGPDGQPGSPEKANCVHQSRQACAKCGWNDDEQRFDVL